MNAFRGRLGNERGYIGIIALLVAVAIGFAIYAMVIKPGMSKSDQKTRQQAGEYGVQLDQNKSVPGAAMDKGREVDCKARLDQLRQGIVMYKTESEGNPPTLAEIRLKVTPDFYQCPAGNEPYSYDPNTGTVKCVHPGHQNL